MLVSRARHTLLLIGLTGLLGCPEDRQQVCAPGVGARCAAGESCAVDQDGAPQCVVPGAATEGQLCQIDDAADPAARCADGYGCVRVAGISRCLNFCDPADATNPCDPPEGEMIPVPVTQGGRHPTWPWSSCAAVLPERVDIGVCVLPCRVGRDFECTEGVCPRYPDDCPDGTTCGVALAAPYPVCVPIAANVGPGQACRPGGLCAAGLVCAHADEEARCRVPAVLTDGNVLVEPCPDGGRPQPLAGAFDPTTGAPVEVCLP